MSPINSYTPNYANSWALIIGINAYQGVWGHILNCELLCGTGSMKSLEDGQGIG
jgi:hypothetical protein